MCICFLTCLRKTGFNCFVLWCEMKKDKKYINELMARLSKAYPHARTELHYSKPVEILIATILSAQCTDERVNKVTSGLFRKYKNIEDYFNVLQEELEKDIKSTGFFRNKAKSIRGATRMIVEKFNGEVPETMEELLMLPGVARKTANVVLGNAFNIAVGIVTDTHVLRLSERLGLSSEKNPEKVERDLMSLISKDKWIDFSHWLVFHGRYVCKARKPDCQGCFLNDICPSAQ